MKCFVRDHLASKPINFLLTNFQVVFVFCFYIWLTCIINWSLSENGQKANVHTYTMPSAQESIINKNGPFFLYIAGESKSSYFVCMVTEKLSETELIDKCLSVVCKIEDVPTYKRRITKREFKSSYGFATSSVLKINV